VSINTALPPEVALLDCSKSWATKLANCTEFGKTYGNHRCWTSVC